MIFSSTRFARDDTSSAVRSRVFAPQPLFAYEHVGLRINRRTADLSHPRTVRFAAVCFLQLFEGTLGARVYEFTHPQYIIYYVRKFLCGYCKVCEGCVRKQKLLSKKEQQATQDNASAGCSRLGHRRGRARYCTRVP